MPKRLPPLPDNYFGSQIDEVSSARDSVIENESQINQYREKVRRQEELVRKLSMPKTSSLNNIKPEIKKAMVSKPPMLPKKPSLNSSKSPNKKPSLTPVNSSTPRGKQASQLKH